MLLRDEVWMKRTGKRNSYAACEAVIVDVEQI